MSVTLYIALERPIHGLDPNQADRVRLNELQNELAYLAQSLDVKPLTAFCSYDRDTVAQYLSEDELETLADSEPQWFDAGEALRTIDALQTAIRRRVGGLLLDGDRVLVELQDCSRVLRIVEQYQTRFRFYMDF